jgi:hypothetical protein
MLILALLNAHGRIHPQHALFKIQDACDMPHEQSVVQHQIGPPEAELGLSDAEQPSMCSTNQAKPGPENIFRLRLPPESARPQVPVSIQSKATQRRVGEV